MEGRRERETRRKTARRIREERDRRGNAMWKRKEKGEQDKT